MLQLGSIAPYIVRALASEVTRTQYRTIVTLHGHRNVSTEHKQQLRMNTNTNTYHANYKS